MAKLLLNLRLATDDEAAEIRELLDRHQVEWYETQPGFWGISAGGIWLRDLERVVEVKTLLDAYQKARVIRVRAELDAARNEGRAPTFFSAFRADPLRMSVKLVAVILLIVLTVSVPFLLLSRAG